MQNTGMGGGGLFSGTGHQGSVQNFSGANPVQNTGMGGVGLFSGTTMTGHKPSGRPSGKGLFASKPASNEGEQEDGQRYVYLTKTGTKYHSRNGCKGADRRVTLQYALNREMLHCKFCGP